LFLDFEGVDGLPTAWEADTWPLPLHLRGAPCWEVDAMLSTVMALLRSQREPRER
jgi:hypothetical protein